MLGPAALASRERQAGRPLHAPVLTGLYHPLAGIFRQAYSRLEQNIRVTDWLSLTIILPELHAVIGALAVLTAYVFSPGRLDDAARPRRWLPRALVGAFAVVVAVKETTWDPVNEVGQPFLWAGAADLSFYLVGIGFMLLAIWIRFRRV